MSRDPSRDRRRHSHSRPEFEPLEGRALMATSSPLLSIIASDTAITAGVGQMFTTSYTVTNQGSQVANDVSLNIGARNEVEGPYDIMSVQVYEQLSLTGSASQGTVIDGLLPLAFSAEFGTLGPGQSATATVSTKVLQAGLDYIDASLTAQGYTPSTQPAASTAISGITQGDLLVAAMPAPQARPGVPETFVFTVTDASGLKLPLDTLFALDFTTTGGGTAGTGVVTNVGRVAALPVYPDGYGGDLGPLSGGDLGIVVATIIPPSSGTVTATLYAYSPYELDRTPGNNLAYAASRVTTAPSILGATLAPASGAISTVLVSFDAPLNAAEARDVRNYALTTATGGRSRVATASAAYDPSTRVVTLRLSRALPRQGSSLRLVVSGPGSPGLAGADGSKLLDPGVALVVPNA